MHVGGWLLLRMGQVQGLKPTSNLGRVAFWKLWVYSEFLIEKFTAEKDVNIQTFL